MLHLFLNPDEAKIKVLQEDTSPDSAGILEGYASVFGNVDHGGDIVMKGAFKKTLKEGLKNGAVKLYDSHMIFDGTSAIIGLVTAAEEDDYGLKFQAKFSSVTRAQEVRTKIKEGILNALSFGYDVVKYLDDEATKTRQLLELKLYEISVVPWGMNPKAMIEAVKSADGTVESREAHFARATRLVKSESGEYVEASRVTPPPPEESTPEFKAFLESLTQEAASIEARRLIHEMNSYLKH